jgi:hypothetical protein
MILGHQAEGTPMPTITTPAHRLAALIAVEREAAERYHQASARVRQQISLGSGHDEYRAAADEVMAALRAMSHARAAVDEALSTMVILTTVAAATA